MKCRLLTFLLILSLKLSAQIEIELIDNAQTDAPPGEAAPAAPEGRDHGSSKVRNVRSEDLLHFLNGDRLSGELLGIDAADGLRWQHADAASEVLFGLENLKLLEFRTAAGPLEDLNLLPRIELTNGDKYRGRILRMDPETLVLLSPVGGEITLRSGMVKSIRPVMTSNAIYQGPNSVEEWTLNNNGNNRPGWEFKKDALYCTNHNMSAGLALEALTDLAKIEFELAWRGNINLQLAFWANDAKNVHQNAYILNLQNGYVRGYRNLDKIGRNDLGNIQSRQDMNDGKLRVELLLNREKKEIIMLFDGQMVARWRDSFDGSIKGNALVFANMSNAEVKLYDVSVRAWDGEFDLDGEEKPSDLDQLITLNGDMFAGQLEKIESDMLFFKNDFAVFQVPMARVSEINLSQASRILPRLQAGDTEIYFDNGERITLQLSALKDDRFSGQSEATGEVSLLRAYFLQMKLNPYDDRHEVDEDAW